MKTTTTTKTTKIELDINQLEIISSALNRYWLHLAEKSETHQKTIKGGMDPWESLDNFLNPDYYEQVMRDINALDLIIYAAKDRVHE